MTQAVFFTTTNRNVAEVILAKVQAMKEFQAKPIPNTFAIEQVEDTYRLTTERRFRVDVRTIEFSEADWEGKLLLFLAAWAKGYAEAYQDFGA